MLGERRGLRKEGERRTMKSIWMGNFLELWTEKADWFSLKIVSMLSCWKLGGRRPFYYFSSTFNQHCLMLRYPTMTNSDALCR